MGIHGRLLIILASTWLWGRPGELAAEDPVSTAASAAEKDAATPEGKKFADEVGAAFGRDQAKNIQACAKETKRPNLSDFHLFIQVGRGGQVEHALVKPSTNLSACVQGKVKGWKVGAPPRTDAWVRVQVRLQRK